MFAAVWQWMGNKDTAIELLKQAVREVSGNLARTAGYERRRLIAAAHTIIVVAAFFEVLEEEIRAKALEEEIKAKALGEKISAKAVSRLRITDAQKIELVTRQRDSLHGSIYELLYTAEIPVPSAARGFAENIPFLSDWFTKFAHHFATFIHDADGEKLDLNWSDVIRNAKDRYESHFLTLAATVPEFMIWALLGENAATRAAVTELRADVTVALDGGRDALNRVEALLALLAAPELATTVPLAAVSAGAVSDLRRCVALANRGILAEKIIPEGARSYGADITFPTMGESYVNPRYRAVIAGASAFPADEGWWNILPAQHDFDLMLAGHITSPGRGPGAFAAARASGRREIDAGEGARGAAAHVGLHGGAGAAAAGGGQRAGHQPDRGRAVSRYQPTHRLVGTRRAEPGHRTGGVA